MNAFDTVGVDDAVENGIDGFVVTGGGAVAWEDEVTGNCEWAGADGLGTLAEAVDDGMFIAGNVGIPGGR